MIASICLPELAKSKNTNEQLSLVAELKQAILAGGAEGVKQKFKELYPAQQAKYHYDPNEIMGLINQQTATGNMEVVTELAEINAILTQAMIKDQMKAAQPQINALIAEHEAAIIAAEKKQQANIDKQEQPIQSKAKPTTQGTMRNDLDRFVGLYGDQSGENQHRRLWVSQTCEGQLVIGATWGDAAPWWMQSVNDNHFDFINQFFSLSVEFKLGKDNRAIEMAHNLNNLTTPMKRVGPLTADYPKCIEPGYR